jgi:hypothetical membrane protein
MNEKIFSYLVLAGTALVVLAVVYSARVYRGKRGERFSLLNHFISELGEVGVSRGAWAFNLGLILGGLSLLPFVVRLGMRLDSVLGWIGMGVGVISTLSVTAVGIFPMNRLKPHSWAALTFFRAGLAMVFFFGLAILTQPAGKIVIPKAANLLSLLAAAAFGSFLLSPRFEKRDNTVGEMLDPEAVPERPAFWLMPFLEWLVFFATLLWLFGMAWFV